MLGRGILGALALLLAAAAAPAQAAPPANDSSGAATPLSLGAQHSQTTTESTTGTEPGTATAPAGCARMGRTVWFRLRGNGHALTLNTNGSTIDTVAAIYDTANTPTDGNRVACDDDGGETNKSLVTVPSTVRGNTYLVQVGAKVQPGCNLDPVESCASHGSITVTANGSPRPANDDRAAPQAIATGTPVTVDNSGATSEPGELLDCNGPYAATIWFAWTAPDPGTPVFDTSAGFETVTAVHREGADPVCASGSRVQAGPVARGEKLLIQVGTRGADGSGLAEGPITLQSSLTPPVTPPPPDFDGDDDGFATPQDCDDANAVIHPGAAEQRGNAVDENCDRVALGFLRITSGIVNRWLVFRGHTRVARLIVRDAPVGAAARVSCRGKGCPRRSRRLKSAGGRELRFTAFLAGRSLKPGAVVVVRITLADRIGKVVRYRIRRRKAPSTSIRCLMPGSKRATACPRGT